MQPDIHSQLLDAVRNYKMPRRAFDLLDEHKPMILVGTTAAGKDTVANYIEENSDWRRMVTTTTRPPRETEVNGDAYWFVSEEQMLNLLKAEAMIEANIFPKGAKTVYGSSITAYEDVIKKGHKPMMTIDINGTEKIIRHAEGVRPYFLLPPSFEEWILRLEKRGSMTHVEKARRFQSATEEIDIALKNEKFIFVVNQDVPQAAKEILGGYPDPATQRRDRDLAMKLKEEISAHHF